MKRNENRGRNVLILISLILTASALFVLLYPFGKDRDKEILIGCTFLAAAFLCFISFSMNRRIYFRPGWLLQSAFFLTLFGILILFLPVLDFELNTTVFSFLAFFFGSAQFCAAIQLSALEIRRWWMVLVFSIVDLLFGVYFLKLCSVLNISQYPSVAVYMIVIAVMLLLEPLVYNKTKIASRKDD
jgi:uncharacterized membrane protein HdeD (DUF308 family)